MERSRRRCRCRHSAVRACALAALIAGSTALALPSIADARQHRSKAAERRALLKKLKHDPRVFATRSFQRRARAAALDIPLTVRLNQAIDTDPGTPGVQLGAAPSDDVLEIVPGGGASPIAAPFGQYAGPQLVTLNGNFELTALFSRDTIGYGVGSALLLGGGSVAMTTTPFDLLNFNPSCNPTADPLLRAGPGLVSAAPPFSPGDHRGGLLRWFTGDISLKLYLQFHFNSQRRGAFDAFNVFSDSCTGNYFWTNAIASNSNPVIPLELTGHFDISPALTTDGRLRLFTLNFDDTVTPQTALAATLHSCVTATTVLATDPAPTAACDGVSGDDTPLSATVKAEKLTAEVLIGSA
jgi:hypothetical protein